MQENIKIIAVLTEEGDLNIHAVDINHIELTMEEEETDDESEALENPTFLAISSIFAFLNPTLLISFAASSRIICLLSSISLVLINDSAILPPEYGFIY